MLLLSRLWVAILPRLTLAGRPGMASSRLSGYGRELERDDVAAEINQISLASADIATVPSQAVLASSRTAALEVEVLELFGLPLFFTSIAIGNPPQPFRLLIDFGWGGIGVRGVDCDGCGDRRPFHYNGSASSSSVSLDESFYMNIGAQFVHGNLAADDVWLSGLQLENMTFGVVDDFHGENFVYDIIADHADGAIGFAPPNATALSFVDETPGRSSKPHPNLLYALMTSQRLGRNIMTLSLPAGSDGKGRIVLGEKPDSIDFTIPLANKRTPWQLENTWNMELHSVTIRGKVPFSLPMSNVHMAIRMSPATVLQLPKAAVDDIYEYLGITNGADTDRGAVIDCERRDDLPDVVLNLAGKEVVLTGEDYSQKLYGMPGAPSPICVVEIAPEYFGGQSAGIGVMMMKKFDLVFDLEKDELGFIHRDQ